MSVRAVRGMNDVLPEVSSRWQFIEAALRELSARFAYQEIRFPILEYTELFTGSIGEITDIVEKEMYSFTDRHGEWLSMRPEGTASCVRAGIDHHLFNRAQVQRLWYLGPMFRYEKPQQGRYRQFHQFGVECFGVDDVSADAELIQMAANLWRELSLDDKIYLEINTLGSYAARAEYSKLLTDYFKQHIDVLDDDAKRRLESNPLRILDSKNPALGSIIQAAPQMNATIDDESAEHFACLQRLLDELGIAYRCNPYLVRGLDYYNRTVFEWKTDLLGAQGTVLAGGRYDGLVEKHGGPKTPAVGFAMGVERLLALVEMQASNVGLNNCCEVFVMSVPEIEASVAHRLADDVRKLGYRTRLTLQQTSLKSQFKKADKSGAVLALLIGADERDTNSVSVKFLREEKPQQSLPLTKLQTMLERELG